MWKDKIIFLYISFISLIFQTISYNSAQPIWLPSPYFRAGNQKVISSMTGNTSTPTYTFTFSSALSGIPNLAYGIKNYRGNDTLLSEMFQVRRVSLTASTFKVSMQIFGFTNIFLMTVPYLAIDPLFPHHLNSFDNVPLNYSSGPLTNFTTSSSTVQYHTEFINYTQQSAANNYKTFQTPLSSNKIVLFISSFFVVGSGTTTTFNPVEMDINYTILNTTHYKWAARLYYKCSVTRLHFSQIVYNQDDVTASKTYAIVYQEWEIDQTGGFKQFPQQLIDNMILALTDFHAYNGRCGFEYNWDFVSNYNSTSFGILINASIPKVAVCGFQYARSTLFYIKTWQCGQPYIYFNLTTDDCQDGCSNYYYANSTAKICDPCYYSCAKCTLPGDSTACTLCEATMHRVLNTTCVCDVGYFDDGYSPGCRACSDPDPYCLTCVYALNISKGSSYYQTLFSSATWKSDILPNYTCITCISNYFLNSSNLCQTCSINYCITCASITACSVCNSSASAVKYTDNLCYLCTVSHCLMCSADNVCSTCSTGYYLVGGLCLLCNQSCTCDGWVLPKINGTCSTLCGDGFMVGLQQCDDNNTVAHDGCSAICKTETCSQNCSCDGWVLPFVNGSCSTLCGDGFSVGAEQCDDNNVVDHDGCSSLCKVQTCSQNCSCDGWVLPFVNGSCSTLCGDGFTVGLEQCDDHNTVDHDGCSSICKIQTCSQNCSCDGWVLPFVNGSCSTLCGDGFKVGPEQCDDSNLIDHDGCSSLCQVETCSQNCSCEGWVLPFVNGSCSTLCGDGFKLGSQECDDNNTMDQDGCSSFCKVQTCSQNCSCQGWVFPFINGSCSTLCGDGYKLGVQQCDDNNIADHDGCSSACKAQACNVSCLCDGWTTPFVNGSCTSICGDGLKRGKQQCDDNNSVSGDGCDKNCLNQLISVLVLPDQPKTFIQEQYTTLPGIVLFLTGFRIVGIEMLSVFQNFQLILNSQNSSEFKISFNIHGYTDSQHFPFEIESKDYIFLHFNFMYLLILVLFVFSSCLELCGLCCRKNNKVQNIISRQNLRKLTQNNFTNSTKFHESNPSQNSDDTGDFAVHYKNEKQTSPQTRVHQLHESILNKQTPSKPVLSVIFRQIFYDLMINSLYVFVYSMVEQIKVEGIKSFLNFNSILTIGSMGVFILIILSFCSIQSPLFGQNQLKFHQGKWMTYWILTVVERIVLSALIAFYQPWCMFMVLGLKLLIIIYFTWNQIFFQKIQKRRNLTIQCLHFTLLLIFTVNQNYLKKQNLLSQLSLPQFSIQLLYLIILSVILFITVAFYIRQIMNSCQADFRKQSQSQSQLLVTQSNGAQSAIFDARNEEETLQDTSQQLQKSSMKGSNIFDELKSNNFQKSSSHLQIPSGKSYATAKNKKIISINFINYLNQANQANIQSESPSTISKKSYQTHKRSYLNSRNSKSATKNVFDHDAQYHQEQQKQQTKQEKQEEAEQKYQSNSEYPEQSPNKFKNTLTRTKGGFMKSTRRIGLKNKRKGNIQTKMTKTEQNQDDSKQISQHKQLKSHNLLYEPKKKQTRLRTFYKNTKVNIKNTNKDSNQFDQDNLSDHYDAVSINFE